MTGGAFVVAIVGAESTGKTTLASDLRERLAARGVRVAAVAEVLRAFCDTRGRTPRADEQAAIADEQMRRIAEAAAAHDIVVADTTALMTAVYSDLVFGDTGLYTWAQQTHAAMCHLTLVTALDLPWQPDGLQRDGAHVREPVDRLLRAALVGARIDHAIVTGSGPARVDAALAAVDRARGPRAGAGAPRWRHVCATCGDPDCERHPRVRAFRRSTHCTLRPRGRRR